MLSESSSLVSNEELTEYNLDVFLDEQLFVDFFNTFLALPCFKQKLFYCKEAELFEEFYEKLADDVGEGDVRAACALRQFSHFKGTIYNISRNKARLGYYVTQLSRDQGFEFVRQHRLQLFQRSELYAEYKLSKLLAQGQLCYLRDDFVEDPHWSDELSLLQKRGRRLSTVSFKLDNDQDIESLTDDGEENGNMPGEFYLPRHISTIEEKLDAWRNSSKNSNSPRTCTDSTFKSILINAKPETAKPGITSNLSDVAENESSSSYYSRQETETSHNRSSSVRPGSAISILSDKLDVDVEESSCSSICSLANSSKECLDEIRKLEGNSRDKDEMDRSENLIGPPLIEMKKKSDVSEDYTNTKKTSYELTTNSPTTEVNQNVLDGDVNLVEKIAESEQNDATIDNKFDSISQTSFDICDHAVSCSPSNDEHELLYCQDVPKSVSFDEFSETVNEENSEKTNIEVEKITQTSETRDSWSLKSSRISESSERDSPVRDGKANHEIGDFKAHGSVSTSPETRCFAETPLISLTSADEKKSEIDEPELLFSEHGNVEEEEEAFNGYNTDADQESFVTLMGIRGVLNTRSRRASMALSVGFEDQDSTCGDEAWDEDMAPYDMTNKTSFDVFKTFLLGTNGEKQFHFWLDAECAKYLQSEGEKELLIKNMQEKYLRCGGIYEFSLETKRKLKLEYASELTFSNLFTTQENVLEPLRNYWCPRFTVHQQHRRTNMELDYLKLVKQRLSCVRRLNEISNVPQCEIHDGLHQVTPSTIRVRPHSSVMPNDSGRSQPQTSKSILRSKSAHPRLIQPYTPVQTNASTLQLQLATAPQRSGYGFSEPKMAAFPPGPEPDYASSCRLFIQPVPSVDSKPQRILRRLQRTSYKSSKTTPVSANSPETRGKAGIDSLIEGLIHEHQTGQLLEMFLVKQGNQLWLNCINFWKCLQIYNGYFYADSLNPLMLARKARYMYANFVVPGGSFDLQLSVDIQGQVRKELDPPFEELFDAVEEHVLFCLLEPWNLLHSEDEALYSEIQKEQKLRHIELKLVTRRRQSVVETVEHELSDDGSDKEKISLEELNRPLPVPKDGFTFESLIRNRSEVNFFKEFLSKRHTKGVKDLMAWTDMETFRRIPRYLEEKRDNKATDVGKNWLNKKYFFGPDSPANRDGQNLITSINGGKEIKERPSSPVIMESQKFIRARIERRWLMMFKQTAEFIERQKPRSNTQEVVEDVMLKRRLQRSEAAWKILNSRWVSSSRDVVALRQTLLNPNTCAQFRAFVAMKTETLENDVQFWLEVQRFKDLCHAHAQDSLIRKKAQAIVECFLNSALSPELPIDIPMELGDKLLDRLSVKNPSIHPYVFREAQTSVFRVLFNQWKDFVAFRSKIPEGEDQLQYIEEQLKKFKADAKTKKEASERRRFTRLSAERKKREKEEREKKRVEDLTSFFNLETASVFQYNDEEEVNSWYYSKHVVEQERQEHMARLKERGIEMPEEFTRISACTDDAKSKRSKSPKTCIRTKMSEEKPTKSLSNTASTIEKPSILVSNRKLPGASSNRRGSVVSFHRSSSVSVAQTPLEITSEKNSTTLEQKEKAKEQEEQKKLDVINHGEKQKQLSTKIVRKPENKAVKDECISEIQVIPEENDPVLGVSKNLRMKLRQASLFGDTGNSNLTNRSKKSQRLPSPTKREASKNKDTWVPLDAISCISDYSTISNIDFMPKKSHSKTVRAGKTPALTPKSLKDFTNSPEGAPLSMPLPLVRITSASIVDNSLEGDSETEPQARLGKPGLFFMQPSLRELNRLTGRTSARRIMSRESGSLKPNPDVIVN